MAAFALGIDEDVRTLAGNGAEWAQEGSVLIQR